MTVLWLNKRTRNDFGILNGNQKGPELTQLCNCLDNACARDTIASKVSKSQFGLIFNLFLALFKPSEVVKKMLQGYFWTKNPSSIMNLGFRGNAPPKTS